MARNAWILCAALGAGLLVQASTAAAQYDEDYASMQRRLAELEGIVADMQSRGDARLASYGTHSEAVYSGSTCDSCGGCDSCDSCGGCGCCCDCEHVGYDFYNCHDRCCGFVAGAEAAFLKPFATNGDLPGADPFFDTGVNFTYEITPRFWFGYVGANGLGVRARYWEFDHHVSGTLDNLTNDELGGGLEFRTIDLEATQQVDFRHWQFQMFGGLRYVETDVSESFTFNGSGGSTSYRFANGFDGLGLTGGIQASRTLLGISNLQWVTGLRGSVLFGDRKYSIDYEDNNFGVDFIDRVDDDLLSILEIYLGPQWAYRLSSGGQLFLRAGLEGQIWLGAGTIEAGPFSDALGDVGFAGFTVSAGLTR